VNEERECALPLSLRKRERQDLDGRGAHAGA
jgi:hypothetical protein